MQYQGGKHLAAKHLVQAIIQNTAAREIIEPFCGGCSVTVQLVKAEFCVRASDINQSLILLWQKALKEDLQPFELNAESYQHWKTAPDSAEKALVGIGASFGGKWFRGIAISQTKTASDYLATSAKVVNRQAAQMRGRVEFSCLDYRNLSPTSGLCYYLDKPYGGVERHASLKPQGSLAFDHNAFWRWVEDRAQNNLLFVSEYQAPFGELVWEGETSLGLAAGRNGAGSKQIERLYKVGK